MNQEFFTKEDYHKIDYLEFSSGFNIDLKEKSKIILGANGIGKTSIYREIFKKENCHCIDYGEIEESFKKNNKRKLTISAQIKILDSKLKDRDDLIKQIDIKGRIKNNFGVSNKDGRKSIHDSLEKINSENFDILEEKFVDDKFNILKELIKEERVFLFQNSKNIVELNDINSYIERIKDSFLKKSFENLEKYLDDEEKICPVCEKKNIKNIKEIIKEKKKKLLKIDNELSRRASELYETKNPEEVKMFLNKIKDKIKNEDINDIDIISFGLDQDEKNPLKKRLSELKKLEEEITKLEEKKAKFYKLLKKEDIQL